MRISDRAQNLWENLRFMAGKMLKFENAKPWRFRTNNLSGVQWMMGSSPPVTSAV